MASIETPDYVIEERIGDNVEIRRYPSMLLAEVDVTGSRQEASSKAFRTLAGFIFGGNVPAASIAMTAPVVVAPGGETGERASEATTGKKIAMTAPVSVAPVASNDGLAGNGVWTVSFTMPATYTRETLPVPTDTSIRIRQTQPSRAIAIRFSGRYTDGNIAEHLSQLKAIMAERDLVAGGSPTVAFYDGPFTPFFLRRNEIICPLAD